MALIDCTLLTTGSVALIDCTVLNTGLFAVVVSWRACEVLDILLELGCNHNSKGLVAPLLDTTGCPCAHSVLYLQAFRVMLAARKRRKKERAAVAFVAQAEESATVTNLQKKLQASKVSMRQGPQNRS